MFERLIEKGAILPAKKTEKFRTVRALRKAENDNPLWIRVGEGESDIPDRNAYVCELGIKGKDLPQDLAEGTELELTVEINAIRELTVTAYIPSIDLRINARSTFIDELVKVDEVELELDAQIGRAQAVSGSATDTQKEQIISALTAASMSLQNARLDEDEKRKAVKQVRELKQILDDTQQASALPQLVLAFNEGITGTGKIIAEVPDQDERTKQTALLAEIKAEGEKAIQEKDRVLLTGINERLHELGGRALFSLPATWVHHFRSLLNDGNFTSQKEAKYFIEQGHQAIEKNDIESLKRSCRGLTALKPLVKAEPIEINASGITR